MNFASTENKAYREGIWMEDTNEIWISGYGRYAVAPHIIAAVERLSLLKRAGVITEAYRGASWTNELWPITLKESV